MYEEKYIGRMRDLNQKETTSPQKVMNTNLLRLVDSVPDELVAYSHEVPPLANSVAECRGVYGTDITTERLSLFSQARQAYAPFFRTKGTPLFSFIDLFAGIGGFRYALQEVGGECLYSSEWDRHAKMTYFANYGQIPFGDITEKRTKAYIPSDFDLLVGGFPCQAFSIAGHQKGFEDTRGTLFFDICTILERHRPKAFLLENVKNLVGHDKGRTFRVMMHSLSDELGYKVKYQVLNSLTHANIPQNRERIFIVGFDPNQVRNADNFNFPEEVPLTRTIHDCLSTEKVPEKYYYAKEHQYYPELERVVTKRDTIYQWRRVYVRENKSNACPTLTANMGTGGHNVPIIKDSYGIRKLTPRECFNFQGFPHDFKLPIMADSKLYMQAGNSVTVPLVYRIAQNIVPILLDE